MGAPKGNKNHLGHRHSLTSRQQMSEAKKGKHYSPSTEFKKSHAAPQKGKTLSLETRRRISESKKGQIPWNKGLGTISSENEKARKSKEARDWRMAVFDRDNYTCQACKTRGGALHADHIKQFAYYPELRYELENGRTLCVDCHRKTDTWGSKIANGVLNLASV